MNTCGGAEKEEMDKSCVRYEDEASFREAVEKASRPISDGDWSTMLGDLHPSYGGWDFSEMVNAIRQKPKEKSSPEQKTINYRRAHAKTSAFEAREITERFRELLFGDKKPPFQDLSAAAEWIESQVGERKTTRLSLQVTVPANLGQRECLIWLRDFLTDKLDHCSPCEDGNEDVLSPLWKTGVVQNIARSVPTLEYFGVDPDGRRDTKVVLAPDGTQLGELQSKAEQLAQILELEPYAAVHHLLTGGLVSSSGVKVSTEYRMSREFRTLHQITLTVTDPLSVTEDQLISAFRKGRSKVLRHQPIKKAKAPSKSERVAALYQETPNMLWAERRIEWNRQFPKDPYHSVSAMKKAHSRAKSSK